MLHILNVYIKTIHIYQMLITGHQRIFSVLLSKDESIQSCLVLHPSRAKGLSSSAELHNGPLA